MSSERVKLVIDGVPIIVVPGAHLRGLMYFSALAKAHFEANKDSSALRIPSDCAKQAVELIIKWIDDAVASGNEAYPFPLSESFTWNVTIYSTLLHLQMSADVVIHARDKLMNAFTTRELTAEEIMALEQCFAQDYDYPKELEKLNDKLFTMVTTTYAYRVKNGHMSQEDTQAFGELMMYCPMLNMAIKEVEKHLAARYPLRNAVTFQGKPGLAVGNGKRTTLPMVSFAGTGKAGGDEKKDVEVVVSLNGGDEEMTDL